MSIVTNGVTIPEDSGEVIYDGVSCTQVICNGAIVWTKVLATHQWTLGSTNDFVGFQNGFMGVMSPTDFEGELIVALGYSPTSPFAPFFDHTGVVQGTITVEVIDTGDIYTFISNGSLYNISGFAPQFEEFCDNNVGNTIAINIVRTV
jgi:hypothetical protein